MLAQKTASSQMRIAFVFPPMFDPMPDGRFAVRLPAMRLGHTTKYAFEALAFLIRSHARDEWAQIADIAAACGIPRKYLEQVLLDLKNAGLVESKKGQKGGYRLHRPPDQISLGQVLHATQGDLLPLPDWLDEPNISLSLESGSGLREVVGQARRAVKTIFDTTTIEVLVCHADAWLGAEMG